MEELVLERGQVGVGMEELRPERDKVVLDGETKVRERLGGRKD